MNFMQGGEFMSPTEVELAPEPVVNLEMGGH